MGCRSGAESHSSPPPASARRRLCVLAPLVLAPRTRAARARAASRYSWASRSWDNRCSPLHPTRGDRRRARSCGAAEGAPPHRHRRAPAFALPCPVARCSAPARQGPGAAHGRLRGARTALVRLTVSARRARSRPQRVRSAPRKASSASWNPSSASVVRPRVRSLRLPSAATARRGYGWLSPARVGSGTSRAFLATCCSPRAVWIPRSRR